MTYPLCDIRSDLTRISDAFKDKLTIFNWMPEISQNNFLKNIKFSIMIIIYLKLLIKCAHLPIQNCRISEISKLISKSVFDFSNRISDPNYNFKSGILIYKLDI